NREVQASATRQIAAASSREWVIERSIRRAPLRSAHAFVRPARRTAGFGRPTISISFHVKRTPIQSAFPTASLPAKRPAQHTSGFARELHYARSASVKQRSLKAG